eukprot:30446_1
MSSAKTDYEILAHSSCTNCPKQIESTADHTNITEMSGDNYSFMVKYNKKINDIVFTTDELKTLNSFKHAVNSAFQMNVNINQIVLYYQCRGEAEEEALIMNNNDEEFNDILYFNNKDIKIIKFIIELD